MAARMSFLTIEEYRHLLPGGLHETCETERHAGQGLPAVAVIILVMDEVGPGEIWSACKDCFAGIDNDLGAAASWHVEIP